MNERLKSFRKSLVPKVTQEEFAKKINLSRANVAALETGRITFTDRVLADICRAYGLSENWLRTGEGKMLATASIEEELAVWSAQLVSSDDDFKKRFVRMLARLDEEEWATLEKMVSLLDARAK